MDKQEVIGTILMLIDSICAEQRDIEKNWGEGAGILMLKAWGCTLQNLHDELSRPESVMPDEKETK